LRGLVCLSGVPLVLDEKSFVSSGHVSPSRGRASIHFACPAAAALAGYIGRSSSRGSIPRRVASHRRSPSRLKTRGAHEMSSDLSSCLSWERPDLTQSARRDPSRHATKCPRDISGGPDRAHTFRCALGLATPVCFRWVGLRSGELH
jgi:hypothetical protein